MYFIFLLLHCTACRTLVPWPRTEPRAWQWKHWILPTGLPGSSEMVHILEGWLQKDFVQNCFSIRYHLLLSSENFIHWQIHSLFNLINELVETKLERSLNFIHLPHSFSLKISGIGSPLMSATLQWMFYHPF